MLYSNGLASFNWTQITVSDLIKELRFLLRPGIPLSSDEDPKLPNDSFVDEEELEPMDNRKIQKTLISSHHLMDTVSTLANHRDSTMQRKLLQ